MKMFLASLSIVIGSSAFGQGPMPPCASAVSQAALSLSSSAQDDRNLFVSNLTVLARNKLGIVWQVDVEDETLKIHELFDVRARINDCRVISINPSNSSESEQQEIKSEAKQYPGSCCHPGRPSKCC